MSLQESVAVANAALDQREVIIGASPFLHFYTGAMPANCAAAATGVQLVVMDLPADWMAAAAAGSKDLAGLWAVKSNAAGLAGYFRLYNNAQTICHQQGTITGLGGGGDMEMDDPNIPNNKWVIVDSYTLTSLSL